LQALATKCSHTFRPIRFQPWLHLRWTFGQSCRFASEEITAIRSSLKWMQLQLAILANSDKLSSGRAQFYSSQWLQWLKWANFFPNQVLVVRNTTSKQYCINHNLKNQTWLIIPFNGSDLWTLSHCTPLATPLELSLHSPS
jgi:hypothetical protein